MSIALWRIAPGPAMRQEAFVAIAPQPAVQVLDPVPNQPGVAPTTALLTLTSCDPRYGSTNRYIVYARLDRTVPRAQGLPPGLLDDPRGA